MTDKPGVVTFTPEEKAMLSGTAELKLEENDAGSPGTDDGSNAPRTADDLANAGEQPNDSTGKEGDGTGGDADGDEEVTEVADGTNPDAPARRKVIAFSAYEKQRQAKKALAEEAAKLREQVAYLSGLAQNAPKAPQTPSAEQTQEISLTPPDKAKEPEKYLAWLEAAAAKALQFEQRTKQQTEQASQFNDINQAVYNHEQAFINGDPESGIDPHPDFLEAVNYLRDKQTKELKAAGYETHEINQILVARAQDVSIRALKAGDSPAKRVYSLAKLNGYKAAAAAPKETEADKIARQAKAQEKAGKTISSLPGGESKGGLTAEALANTSPDEFLKAWNSGEAKKLMGWKD